MCPTAWAPTTLRRSSRASDPEDPIAVDCVVRIDAVLLDEAEVGEATPFESTVGDRVAIEPDGFDLLRSDVLGRTAFSAYAVPASAVRTLGVRFETALGTAAPSVFWPGPSKCAAFAVLVTHR